MDPDGWTMTPGHYAFAAGLLVGTMEGGFVVHLKGIVLIEVPGPRLLLVMKADVLSLPPALKSTESATFLAVLDIDFGRGTITIGVVAQYEIEYLLKVRVPVTAFFDTHAPENWLVELGNYTDRVTVEVLDVITGDGYLMVHGNGVAIPGLPPVTHGLAVAAGFHIQAVLMGSKSAGLYLEVAAGFDAILGLEPFFVAGKIYVRGELRLFIVSIGASAELTVLVGERVVDSQPQDQTYVHGEVCGEVDFFFFSVEGCVSLTIGDEPDKTPVPRDLVGGVTLVSRSPALLEGTATERSVDGKIDDARSTTSTSTEPLPSVPLDAVPVVLFRSAPIASGNIVMGAAPFGQSGAAANPWTRIGDRWWKYELVSVNLAGGLQPANGKVPSTWWTSAPPSDPANGPALALLDWLPTPFSRAIPYGEALTEQVDHRWGTVCNPPAPAAPVLWTFDHKPIGPSDTGWRLDGIPWPDPPDMVRTSPVEGVVDVTEAWRTGDAQTDRLQGTQPAIVVGDAVPCYARNGVDPASPLGGWETGQPASFSRRVLARDGAAFAEAAELLAGGVPLGDLAAAHGQGSWDPSLPTLMRLAEHRKLGCDGRILRSPLVDRREPAPFGTPEDRERVERVRQNLGFEPDPLADAVRVHAVGGLGALTALLLVPERAVGGQLVLRFEDPDGNVVAERRLDGSALVDAGNPLPAAWVDSSGPWADPVQRSGRIAARVAATAGVPLMLALLEMRDLPEGTSEVVIGWDRKDLHKNVDEPFYVVALSALIASEATRASWDETVVTSDQQALSNALTQDPDDHALLVPGTTYTVEVTWRAAALEQEAQPSAAATASWITPNTTQSFRFTADDQSKSPTDLAPWLLTTSPGMNDVGVFCRDPVRIAFATQNVAALFDAYGKELRVIVHAASGKHPEPPGGGDPGAPFAVPVQATGLYAAVGAAPFDVKSPWLEVVSERAGRLECIDDTGASSQTYTLTLPYDFEPLTDYLIDIQAVPKGSPASATGLVQRIGFTTSRFADVADLASYIGPGSLRHRVVTDPTALAALPERPSGDQLDNAFQAAGLPVPQTPDYPAVQVLWSADATPQPVAVVIESSEPLWRSRLMPTVVPAPADASDPTHKFWGVRPADWLSLSSSIAPAAGGDLARASVTKIVRGPGDTRAIALLASGSRGTEVRLDLVTAADALAGTPEGRATAVRVGLVRAPWEVED